MPISSPNFRHRGRRLVLDLDVAGFGPDDDALLRGAAAVILNRIGFGRSFGDAKPDAVLRWMATHEVGLLVRTLAEDGAEIYDGTSVAARPALRVPVVDVTGAGDTFGGALVHGLAHGRPMEETIEIAIAAGSRAVTIEGPQGGVVSLPALRDFALAHGRSWAPI